MKKQPTRLDQVRQFDKFISGCVLDTLLMANIDNAVEQPDQPKVKPPTFRYHSLRQVRDQYGLACSKLFSILFVKWFRGGRNLHGQAYKTAWRLDWDACIAFNNFIHSHAKGNDKFTAGDMLALMSEAGHQSKERIKIWNDLDMGSYEAHIEQGEDHAELKELKRVQMQQIREHFKNLKEENTAVHH